MISRPTHVLGLVCCLAVSIGCGGARSGGGSGTLDNDAGDDVAKDASIGVDGGPDDAGVEFDALPVDTAIAPDVPQYDSLRLDSAPTDRASSCSGSQTSCGGICVTTATDTNNCGSCGTRCGSDQTCSFGRCVTSTPSTTRAGAACTNPSPMSGSDPACGADLMCVVTSTTPMCSRACTNSPSQATEQAMCGGTGSTCLVRGEGATSLSVCAAACRPAGMVVATGACRPGFVCTGWWYTHAGSVPDSPGCFPFCSSNADCGAGAAGSICNVRRGICGTSAFDSARLPDGAPCNPMTTVMVPGSTTPQNVQCRGLCFRVGITDATQGNCGSLINTRGAPGCPDDPDYVQPLVPTNEDNLALCVFRQCTRNAECRSPHICRYDEQMGVPATDRPTYCNYPTTAQPTGRP